jgi:hypothetical protein
MKVLRRSPERIRARIALLVAVLGLVAGLHAVAPSRAHAMDSDGNCGGEVCVTDDGSGGVGGGTGYGDTGGGDWADTGSGGDAGDAGGQGSDAGTDPGDAGAGADRGDQAGGDPSATDPSPTDPSAGLSDDPAARGERGDEYEGIDDPPEPDNPDDPNGVELIPIPDAERPPWITRPPGPPPECQDAIKRYGDALYDPKASITQVDEAEWQVWVCESQHNSAAVVARTDPGAEHATTVAATGQQALAALAEVRSASVLEHVAVRAATRVAARGASRAMKSRKGHMRKHDDGIRLGAKLG